MGPCLSLQLGRSSLGCSHYPKCSIWSQTENLHWAVFGKFLWHQTGQLFADYALCNAVHMFPDSQPMKFAQSPRKMSTLVGVEWHLLILCLHPIIRQTNRSQPAAGLPDHIGHPVCLTRSGMTRPGIVPLPSHLPLPPLGALVNEYPILMLVVLHLLCLARGT